MSFAKNAKPGDCFCLFGELGAGKTEFSRAFIQALCGNVKVTSPTYNILLTYEGENCTVNHFDLYRIKDASELEDIGFHEAVASGISLIEWPQIAAGQLPKNAKKIVIEITGEGTRKIKCL
mgnify:CR=1 FL=1